MRRKNIIGQVCDTPKSYDNVMHVGLRKVTFKWQRGNKIGKETEERDTKVASLRNGNNCTSLGSSRFSYRRGRSFAEGSGFLFVQMSYICKMCSKSNMRGDFGFLSGSLNRLVLLDNSRSCQLAICSS